MKILGISCYYHDASATLLIDGRVVSAVAEERFTRKKHDSSFPINAINFCLSANNLNIKDIDYIAFYEKPILKFERFLKFSTLGFPRTFLSFVSSIPAWVKEKMFILSTIRKKLKYKGQVFFIDHHISHAASFFASPFEKAAILTVDGVGEYTTASYGFGSQNRLEIRKEINFPHSLGLLYSAITAYLGFSVNDSEYKVMGLAAYGNQDKETNKYYEKIKKVINLKDDGSFELDMSFFTYQFGRTMCSKKMFDLLGGKPRKEKEQVLEKHKDIAAALQIITEEVLILMLKNLHGEFSFDNLIFSGGVALNSVFNGKILKNTEFKNVWIIPDPGDGGTSVGCAMYLYNQILEKPRASVLDTAYLGPEFSNEQIKKFLDNNSVKYREFESQEEIVKETAKLIFENNVVGWFQGKMEFGPRALGNRSILANPLNPKMQDILNLKVKHREQFRPFAPVVLKEEVDNFFECDKTFQESCNFMLMVYPIRLEWRERLPAVTHVDGSGRLQTVSEEDNFLYYNLVKEFGKLSGVPILVNTSFNVRGEPIVCTPEDAYKCMLGTEIDYLVMGKFLIKRSENINIVKMQEDKPRNSNFLNVAKKVLGTLMLAFGIFINQILISNFLPKLSLIKSHKIIFSAIEVFIIILGSLLLFAPSVMTMENIGKAKRKIGVFMLATGLILNPVVIANFFIKDLNIKTLSFSLIFFLEIIAIFLGLLFIIKPEALTIKKIFDKKKEILLVIICLLLTDFLLSFFVPQVYGVKCKEGWCVGEGHGKTTIEDTPNIIRRITIINYKDGFKRWGNLSDTTKKRVLVIGDSFTQDSYVSNGEEWYAFLERAFPNATFFVKGVSGYGSLQEYMILDKYIDEINPDVVLWQFCNNDYDNNYYPFDRLLYGRNNLGTRPYLENGNIVYRLAGPYASLRKHSVVLDKLFALYDVSVKNKTDQSRKGLKIPEEVFVGSKKATEDIMEKIKNRLAGRKAYMFNSTGPIREEEKKLCQISGMVCIENIQEKLEALNGKEGVVHPVGNGHWNLRGNKIVGDLLVDYFKKNNILKNY